MARRRTLVRRGGRTGPRRKLVWARQLANFTFTTNTPQQVNLLSDFEAEAQYMPIGVTVRRLIIRNTWAINTAGDSNQIAIGFLVGSDTLDPISPVVNRYEDWMYWDSRGFNGALTDAYTWEADIRAGRKLDEVNQELSVHAAANSTGVFDYQLLVVASILLALP